MVATASGETLSEALELLSAAIPRRINLTQVKLIAISRQLAESEKFKTLMREMAGTYQLYGTAHMVICVGKAEEFIRNQEPVIGTRISTAIIALLDHYKEQGYIPESTFADVYYRIHSIYGDPLVTLAGSADQESDPVREIPPAILPDEVPAKLMDDKNDYLGAAIIRDGIMVGTFTAREMLAANLIRGRKMKFDYSLNGETVSLTADSAPKISVDTKSYPVKIEYEQTLLAVPLIQLPDLDELEIALQKDFEQVMEKCQALKTDPFFLAEKAAGNFRTIEKFLQFGWNHHFAEADIRIKIHIRELKE